MVKKSFFLDCKNVEIKGNNFFCETIVMILILLLPLYRVYLYEYIIYFFEHL